MDSYPDNSSHAASSDPANTLTKLRGFRPLSRLEELLPTFSSSERLILYILTAVLAVSALVLLTGANAQVSVIVPASGGSLTEGVVGTARFINPRRRLHNSRSGILIQNIRRRHDLYVYVAPRHNLSQRNAYNVFRRYVHRADGAKSGYQESAQG